MTPEEILRQARESIRRHAGDDEDKWFYANRYVFARLQLDERKTKRRVKQLLTRSGRPCHHCGRPFESTLGVHLHRLDGNRGYSLANCALMHPDCHRDHHARDVRGQGDGEPDAVADSVDKSAVVKRSKRYYDGAFLYWWDFSPSWGSALGDYESVEFVKKDSGESCICSAQELTPFLVGRRQTSRGAGNWGVKVLRERPDELAFEPGRGGGEWLFLPVVWLSEDED